MEKVLCFTVHNNTPTINSRNREEPFFLRRRTQSRLDLIHESIHDSAEYSSGTSKCKAPSSSTELPSLGSRFFHHLRVFVSVLDFSPVSVLLTTFCQSFCHAHACFLFAPVSLLSVIGLSRACMLFSMLKNFRNFQVRGHANFDSLFFSGGNIFNQNIRYLRVMNLHQKPIRSGKCQKKRFKHCLQTSARSPPRPHRQGPCQLEQGHQGWAS